MTFKYLRRSQRVVQEYPPMRLSSIIPHAQLAQSMAARLICIHVVLALLTIIPFSAIAQRGEGQTDSDKAKGSGNPFRDLGKAVECKALEAASLFDEPGDKGSGDCKTTSPKAKGPDPNVVRSCNVVHVQSTQSVDINADNLSEFFNKIKGALGGHPHLEPGYSSNVVRNGKDGIDVTLTLKTKIVVPRLRMCRCSEDDFALMQRAVETINQHELRHRAISERIADEMCDIRGSSLDEARARAKGLECRAHPARQAALDAKEGSIEPVFNVGRTRITDFRLTGVTNDYTEKDCAGPL